MFDNMENLEIVSSLHRKNKTASKIENRSTHSFLIRARGSVVYNFYDRTVQVNEGEMMYIPKGLYYEYTTDPSEECVYTSINFLADFPPMPPTLFSMHNFPDTDFIINHFADLWKFGTQSEKYKCLSLFYSLLSYLSESDNTTYPDKKKHQIIEPAISYLKENIYNCSLKIDKLHKLCGISDTYFRKIFISKFGVTPNNYITSRRMSHAMSIFDSGDFDTVKEVAQSVGYSDPLYFSKVFKKTYGISPTDINNF